MDLKRYFNKFLDWILPNQCIGCNSFTIGMICESCIDLIKIEPKILNRIDLLDTCFGLTKYNGLIKNLLSYLKFEFWQETSIIFEESLKKISPPLPIDEYDFIIPVPLHDKRFNRRGYNQVTLIFHKWIANNNGNWINAIKRIKNTPPLYELTPKKRQNVLDDAFQIIPGVDVTNKNILILDDILTTGTTLGCIAKILKDKGAKTVSALVYSYGDLKSGK